jgi:NTP pyrophosphatase (non-canonical NTP hydrolase)
MTAKRTALLDANVHKGDNWEEMGDSWLFSRLQQEVYELRGALWGGPNCDMKPEATILECADVANYCLFIADIARQKVKG